MRKKQTQKTGTWELIVACMGRPGFNATAFEMTPAYPNLEEALPHGTCRLVGAAGMLGTLDGACPVTRVDR